MHPSHGHDMTIVNGISRIGFMSGGQAARWVDEDIADTLTARALRFIERHRDAPFFLYFSTHDIHVPRVPHGRFAGTSGLGARGDVILQLDWVVGEIMRAVERHDLEEHTLILFTSDNGPVLDDGYQDQAVELRGDHEPSGPFRGGKYSAFEAGTRVPFIVHWPGVVSPGTSAALISQVDLLATFAALLGVGVDPEEGPDSFNLLPYLLGTGAIPADALASESDARFGAAGAVREQQGGRGGSPRDHLIEHNAAGTLSIVRGPWKYIEPSAAAAYNPLVDIELGNAPEPQLYRIDTDRGEARNLAADFPEVVGQLSRLLETYRRAGATRPDAELAPQ
jgi:arylsulfatase A-like enzyme